MGKQSRRKHRHNNRNKHSPAAKPNSNTDNSSNAAGSTNLINRIRHGDIKVRHGALTALSSTVFSPESLEQSQSKKKKKNQELITMELLQAIGDRIMDQDVPIASCATGCLANYILFGMMNSNNDASSADSVATAKKQGATMPTPNRVETTMTPILLSRMNLACATIQSLVPNLLSTSSAAATSKQKEQIVKKLMEQYTLLSLTLHALCGLVEGASSTTSSSLILFHEQDALLTSCSKAFQIAIELLLTIQQQSNGNDDQKLDEEARKMIQDQEDIWNVLSDVTIYIARILHASSDDNPSFVKALFLSSTNNKTVKTSGDSNDDVSVAIAIGRQLITSCITNHHLPTMARLHCSGIILTSWQTLFSTSTPTASQEEELKELQKQLETLIQSQVLPLLHQTTQFSPDIATALCTQIIQTKTELLEEKQDESIEREIIRKVEKRKENARSIARRQKEMKDKKKQEEAEEKSETKQVVDETMEGAEGDKEKAEKQEEQDERIEKYEKAVRAWENAYLPLKLSVEIITNLCSSSDSQNNEDVPYGMDGDDDEMAWDSDQEEMLMASEMTPSCQNPQNSFSECNKALFEQVVLSGIPDTVLGAYGSILLHLMNLNNPQSDQTTCPDIAVEDMMEILSKCGICLGNIVCNIEGWKKTDDEVKAVWKDLAQSLKGTMQLTENESISLRIIAVLVTTMSSFLRFRPASQACIDEEILQVILSCVLLEGEVASAATTTSNTTSSVENNDNTITISEIQTDASSMLGLLCSQPHKHEINAKICTTFSTLLTRSNNGPSASVMNEVLNILMDMYSADSGDPDNHEDVFRAQNVLGMFERIVPTFKSKIRGESQNALVNRDDIQIWKETSLNMTRFIKYKKGN